MRWVVIAIIVLVFLGMNGFNVENTFDHIITTGEEVLKNDNHIY